MRPCLKYSAHSVKMISEHLGDIFFFFFESTETIKSNQIITVYHMLLVQPIPMISCILMLLASIRSSKGIFFQRKSSLGFFLISVHTRVWVILGQTIFLPDFIMPQLHFFSLHFLTGLPRTGLSLYLCVLSLVSNSFTLAAAAAANKNGDEDDAGQHGHGDNQNLEVYPTQPPSCII